MITKVTRDVLDISTRPIDGGLDINGDGTANFSIDGTIIGANFPAAGDFTTISANNLFVSNFNASSASFNVISSNSTGNIAFADQIRVDSGTAILPSIAPSSHPSTGLFWDTADANETKFSNFGNHTWSIESSGFFVPVGSRDIGTPTSRVANLFVDNLDANTGAGSTITFAPASNVYNASVSSQAISPQSLILAQINNSLLNTTGGYQIFPGRFVIEWGRIQNVGPGSYVITLPLALSTLNITSQIAVHVTPWSTDRPPGGTQDGHGGLALSNTQIRIWHRYDGIVDLSWMVYGFVAGTSVS